MLSALMHKHFKKVKHTDSGAVPVHKVHSLDVRNSRAEKKGVEWVCVCQTYWEKCHCVCLCVSTCVLVCLHVGEFSFFPERLWIRGHGSLRCTEEAGQHSERRCVLLINVAFAVGMRLAVGPLLNVRHVLVKVRQRHRVLLVDLPLHVRL